MSQGLNKILLIGSLGTEPEMRFSPSGKPVTTFTILVNRVWSGSDNESHSQTECFNVITWGDLAEKCHEFLNKTQRVYLEGRIQTRQWVDDTGMKNSSIEIIAHEVIILNDYDKELDDNI